MKINDVPVQDAEHIKLILERVMSGSEEFAVLERDGQHFIQTDGYGLEYKNPAGLYRAEQNEFTLRELTEIFLNYYHGGNACVNAYQWKEVPGFSEWEVEEKDDRPPPRTLREKIHRLFGL
jgi:hypothetical protein